MSTRPLVRALTEAGFGSRREAAATIKRGGVTVNGNVAASFTMPVNPGKDSILVDGRPFDLRPRRHIYLMLHKPAGVLSTTGDTHGGRTVLDIIPPEYRDANLYPAGRLDKDTTGLLLLTNDGELTYRLTHPKFEREKEYIVATGSRLTREETERLRRGVRLEDRTTRPARVKYLPGTRFEYNIVIHEGRKRQVRRMFEKVGHPVLSLKRTRVGNLRLGDLKEGDVRELSRDEITSLLRR